MAKKKAKKEATPAAEELAEEAGIDVEEVEGSGKDGKVTKSDVKEKVEKEDSPEEQLGNMRSTIRDILDTADLNSDAKSRLRDLL